jgi:hypothetical protein
VFSHEYFLLLLCVHTHAYLANIHNTLAENSKVKDLQEGYDALDAADTEWNEHKDQLGELDRKIVAEEDNLGQLDEKNQELGKHNFARDLFPRTYSFYFFFVLA